MSADIHLPDRATCEQIHHARGALGVFIDRAADRSSVCVLIVPTPCAGRNDTPVGRRVGNKWPDADLARMSADARKMGQCIFTMCDVEPDLSPRVVCRVIDRIQPSRPSVPSSFRKAMAHLARTMSRRPVEARATCILVDDSLCSLEMAREFCALARKCHFVVVSSASPSAPSTAPSTASPSAPSPAGSSSAPPPAP